MSGIQDTATVTLCVNGADAKKFMSELETKVSQTEAKIAKLQQTMADPKQIEKAKKELRTYKKQLDEARSSVEGVGKDLSNLDKFTLGQLQNEFRKLNKQLKHITPGSELWDSHVEKINLVKERLAELRAEVGHQKSAWDKFTGFANKIFAPVILADRGFNAVKGAITEYVDAFAAMDQEMANVRKFTGMTAEQVDGLNDELKKIDTRTSREDLNKLAQEAGRLGKTSQEDVLGFVRAANQINVALDDLGEGATLTLSKLTGMFGDEARYGTEQSLLKVGSVINELSQNCSASAPYLAEFASRLSGVGSQAGMTVSEIMAFGAVLDANGQQVEASSTALSQIMVRLYQDPAKYAKVAGLDVEQFAAKVRTDMNGALVELLDTLNKSGKMDTLAPMFQDMGETGARAINTLSTLAQHIDEVKAQQIAANRAFEEGTSVGNEFAVQNSTAAAELEKSKNAAHEMAVELGQQLYPLMGALLNTGTGVMSMISATIKWIMSHKTAVVTLAATLGAYLLIVKAQVLWTKACNAATAIHYGLLVAQSKAVNILKATVAGLRVAYLKVTGQIQAAAAAQRAFNGAAAASGIGALVAVIGTLVAAFIALNDNTDEAREKEAQLREEHAKWKKSLTDINKASSDYAAEETTRLRTLYKEATNEASARDKRLAAAAQLQKLYPAYFANLSKEQIMVGGAKKQYDDLAASILEAARARAAFEKIKENEKIIIEKELEIEQLKKGIEKAEKEEASQNRKEKPSVTPTPMSGQYNQKNPLTGKTPAQENVDRMIRRDARKINEGAIREKEKTIQELRESNDLLAGIAKGNKDVPTPSPSVTPSAISTSGGGGTTTSDTGGSKFTLNADAVEAQQPYVSEKQKKKAEREQKKEEREAAAAERKKKAEAKAAELQKKRNEAIASKDYKDKMRHAKAEYESNMADNVADTGAGLKSYEAYLAEKERLDLKYIDDRIAVYESLYKGENETDKTLLLKYEDEYQQLRLKRAELVEKQASAQSKKEVDRLKQEYEDLREAMELEALTDGENYMDEQAQQEALFQLKIEYLRKYRDAYKENSKEYADYDRQIKDEDEKRRLQREKSLREKQAEIENTFSTYSAERQRDIELAMVNELYDKKKITEEQYQLWLMKIWRKLRQQSQEVADNVDDAKYMVDTPGGGKADIRATRERADARGARAKTEREQAEGDIRDLFNKGLISEDELKSGLAAIRQSYYKEIFDPIREGLDEQTRMLFDFGLAWASFFEGISDNGALTFEDFTNIVKNSVAVMTAVMQQYSDFMSAQSRIDQARTKQKYDKEIEAVQGNTYKTKKLEKKKEEELAKIKAKYAKKEFAIKVIMAIAQTAQNALQAYSSGLQAPFPLSTWLPPVLAGAAAAQGAVQVALLKKQQQAAEAEGYAEGGFTRPGGKYEPAGVVHAGEWVASQKLLSSPVARPLIDALDYVQRTNTIGSLRAEDVSRSITANNTLARYAESDESGTLVAAAVAQSSRAVSRLTQRLEEPFVTVNTVTGDHGIKQAQDEYTRLMNNVTPKSKRKQ